MSKVLITESKLTAIGNAIRAKAGTSDEMTLDEMAAKIGTITTEDSNSALYKSVIDGTVSGKITLPEELTALRKYAFAYCDKITGITFNTTIMSVPENAFWSCMGITSLDLPANITTIGDYSFGYMLNCENIDIRGEATIHDCAFQSTGSSNGRLNLRENCTLATNALAGYLGKVVIYKPNTQATGDIGLRSESTIYVYYTALKAYRNRTNFSKYASQIQPIYQVITYKLSATPSEFYVVMGDGTQYKKGTEVHSVKNSDTFKLVSGTYDTCSKAVTMQQSGYFGTKSIGTLTLTQNNPVVNISIPSGATLDMTYDGATLAGTALRSFRMASGTSFSYTVHLSGYKDYTATATSSSSNTSYSITTSSMTKESAVSVDIVKPFTGTAYDLSHLVDGKNFVIDTAAGKIKSDSSSHNVDSGSSFGYIQFKTPSTGSDLSITATVSSEASFDFGYILLSNTVPSAWNNSTVREANADTTTKFTSPLSSPTMIAKSSGPAAGINYTATLAGGLTYYLAFGYTKDDSGDENDDRFYIEEIKYTALQ